MFVMFSSCRHFEAQCSYVANWKNVHPSSSSKGMWEWCYGHIKYCTHGNYRSWVLSRQPVFTCLIYVIALSVPICSCALWVCSFLTRENVVEFGE